MKNTHKKFLILGASISLLLLISTTAPAINVLYEENEKATTHPQSMQSMSYDGELRIYIAEPESRWYNQPGSNDEPLQYHYGFLDFALNDAISLDYQSSYTDSIVWDGDQNGWGDITEDNIIVMAAVFNPEAFEKFSRPPDENPFDAHYVDAAAAATPGTTGYNTVNENFSHTVLVEEGTGTFCPPCRDAMTALENIYESGDYPMYFLSMVMDENGVANSYMGQTYNVYGIPAVYFDGGARVQIGASSSIESTYRNMIESTGQRDVHDFNLTLSLEWLGNAQLQIDINLTNNEPMNPPETPSAPQGPSTGYAGVEYAFEVVTTDPEDNNIIYTIDWGDGTIEDSTIYSSGTTVELKHRWAEPGTYLVRVKARDTGGGGYESDWSTPTEITIEPPLFDITINGGLFEVSAQVVNSAEEPFTDINWSITVSGGLLNGIDVSQQGGIPQLDAGEEKKISPSDSIIGFGKIDIEVMVEDTQKTATGFVLGFFVLIR